MTAIKITEAAIELGIRKGQAITLADMGVLHYVTSGKNGKAKTVTLDSVWAAKKEPKESILARISQKVPKTAQEKPQEKADGVEGGGQKKCGEVIVEVLDAILKELRQLRGIVCKDGKPVQAELGV